MKLKNVKTVKVRPIAGYVPPKYRKMPGVLRAAIKNVYQIAWPVRQLEAGHWRIETSLCTIDYTVPSPDGRCCLMRAYRKEALHGLPDKTPFCVARYIMEDKNGCMDGDRHRADGGLSGLSYRRGARNRQGREQARL